MSKHKTSERQEVDKIIEHIINGEIRKYNYAELIPHLLYAKHASIFNNAFKYREDALRQAFIRKRSDGYSNKINVLWLYGPAGSDKTEFAKYKCRALNLPFYISASGNYPLDDYKGQPAIILDCIYPYNFDIAMLLKLLDPNESREFKARYRNKWIEAEWIFITCLESPQEWWQKYLSKYPNAGEIEQLTRLITLGSWEMSHTSAIVHLYDDKGHNLDTCENNLPSDFLAQFSNQQDRDMTKEELEAYADSLFGQLLKK